MAAKLIVISTVSGAPTTYTITVDSSTGILVNDHVSDAAGHVYRVSAIAGVSLTLADDVAPLAPVGAPITGTGAAYTPTTNLKLSQAPRDTIAWDEIIRRDLRVLDSSAAVSVASPQSISDSTNTAGVATQASPADHVHAHGNRGGGTLHAAATSTTAGFMSAADKSKVDALYTTAPLTYYVETTGNDSNDGLSVGTAFATIQKAIDSVPKKVRHAVNINVGSGNFAGFMMNGYSIDYVDYTTASFIMMTGTMINATLATGAATGTVSSVTGGVFASGTYTTITDTTQSWTVNDLRGKHFVTTGGTGSGQSYPIVSNTATQVTLCVTTMTTVADATTTYAIQEPGTNINTLINVPGSAPTGVSAVVACAHIAGNQTKGDRTVLLFRQLKFSPPSTRGLSVADNVACTFQNCTFSCTGVTNSVGTSGSSSAGRLVFQACAFLTTGSGVHLQLGAQSGVSGAGTILQCLFVNGIGMAISGTWSITNCHFTGCNTGIRSNGELIIFQGGSGMQFVSCTTGIQSGMETAGVGWIAMQTNNPYTFTNCGTAINFNGVKSTFTNSGGGTGGLIGSGNTVAISLARGARLQYTAISTLTGTTEISIDGVTETVANLRAASPRLLTNTYGTIIYE